MDFLLPDGDGASATEAIRATMPEIPVLLLTAVSGHDVVRRAIEAGCCGLVRKTEPVARVRSAIRRAAAGEAVFTPESLAGVVSGGGYDARATLAPLTAREQDVLRLLVAGSSTEVIADELVLSLHTVRNHVRNLMQKLGAHSRLEAVAIALRQGLVAVGPREGDGLV
jgi:DNA-binding NarL/FixJ family response regulator